MLEMIVTFPLAVLANWQVLEIWRHGSLFAGARAWLEARGGVASEPLLCTFCLSNWTAAILTVPGLYRVFGDDWNALAWWWPVSALAVARAANLLNDWSHPFCRTPKVEDEIARLDRVGGGDFTFTAGRGGRGPANE